MPNCRTRVDKKIAEYLRRRMAHQPITIILTFAIALISQPESKAVAQTAACQRTEEATYIVVGQAAITKPLSTNDAELINNQIDKAARCGGGTVVLPAGAFNIGPPGIRLQTSVSLRGAGRAATLLLCSVGTTSACITKNVQDQLYGVRLSDFGVRPSTTEDNSDTVIAFDNIQASEISNLLIEGFIDGTWLRLGGGLPSTESNTNLGGNVVWNNIHDVVIYGCGECAVIGGVIARTGATPGYPSQLVTQNHFDNINMFYVKRTGWDIVEAADTNTFFGGLINLFGTNSVGVASGDDPKYLTQNVYVGNNKFYGLAFSHEKTISATLFGGNYSTGTEGYGVESDVDSTPTLKSVDMPRAVSYRFCGNGHFAAGSGTLLGCKEKGVLGKGEQIMPITENFHETISIDYGIVIISGPLQVEAGHLQLPCSPVDGKEISITSLNSEIKRLTLSSCSNGAQNRQEVVVSISPMTAVRLHFVGQLTRWVSF